MENSIQNSKTRENMIDFHVHGIGSSFKDSFATASYDHVCAYFQKVADDNNANVTIAITEHDCSVMTFEKYKELQKKYPNVKIVLGMESNTNLRTATNDIFNQAHVLTYADMSSDESVKRWLDCKELKDLSKINTFQLPCNYQFVKDYCIAFNVLYKTNLDSEEIAKKFGDSRLSKDFVVAKLFETVLNEVMENPSGYFSNCHTKEQFKQKLKNTKVMKVKGDVEYTLGLKPSIYGRQRLIENLGLALDRYNKIYGDNVQLDSLKKQIHFATLNQDDLDARFIRWVAGKIANNEVACKKIGTLDKSNAINFIVSKITKDNHHPHIDYDEYAKNGPKIDQLGQKFYIAKSILNKHIGINLTNDALARMLDYSKPRNNIRKEFVFWVRKLIEKQNPNLYKEIKDLDDKQFCEYKFGTNKHGDITINNLVSEKQYEQKFQSSDVRTSLEEINAIVKKAGAHLVLAHPNSKFDFKEGEIITADSLKDFDSEFISKRTKEHFVDLCKNNKSITVEEFKQYENVRLSKLDLFFKLCQRKGINFEGFELSKSDLHDSGLMNSLIYAAKHNLEISFGTDTHLSNLHEYYNLLNEGKLDQKTFEKLVERAYLIKDNTADGNRHEKSYNSIFIPGGTRKNSKLLTNPILKSHAHVIKQKGYKVSKTSFCDKITGKNNDVLLGLTIDNQKFEFDRETLKNMHYKIQGVKKEDKQKNNQNINHNLDKKSL